MSFNDIKGQDIPVSFLKRAIESNSIAHAYLFSGIDGIGKTFAANTFAKALNCEKAAGDSCDICALCRKIDNRNHPDLLRLVPEGNKGKGVIKIEAVRYAIERVSLRPYEGKWKVCTIEDAHLMTEEAANAFLKTLEEPPDKSVFILISSNIAGIFPTIISRCQLIKFSPLSNGVIENILIKKFGFRKEAAEIISRLSAGGINRKASSDSERFIAWKNRVIDEFMDGSFFKEGSLLFTSSKEDFQEALEVLINWHRDILFYQKRADRSSIINFDRLKEISVFSDEFSYEKINGRINSLMEAYLAVDQNVGQKIIIGALV